MNMSWSGVRTVCFHVTLWLMASLPLLVVGTAGAAFLATPAWEETSDTGWFAVARLSALQPGERPQRLPVLQPARNAWTWLPGRVLGHVFVRCRADGTLLVLRAEHHPTFRIPVLYDEQKGIFYSRCWRVRFELDGKELHDQDLGTGFDMEQLAIQVRAGEVFVYYGPPRHQWPVQR